MPESDASLRAAALSRLTAALRGLIDTTVQVGGDAALLADAAAQVERLTQALRVAVPETPPLRFDGGAATPEGLFAYDYVMGKWNPLAAPLRIEWQEPKSVAEATFGIAYEGPPGCVHGAAIAAAFDQVLNIANLMSGAAGPTARLTLHYRRPTPLHRVLRFEGWVERREERKVHAAGRLLVDGEVCAEAQGLFIVLDAERVMRLLDR
ncbi:MAG: PaaI family thioesterase [Candidatus Binatia bacterium]